MKLMDLIPKDVPVICGKCGKRIKKTDSFFNGLCKKCWKKQVDAMDMDQRCNEGRQKRYTDLEHPERNHWPEAYND